MITENSAVLAAIGLLGLILGVVFIVLAVIWLQEFRFALRNTNDEINRNEGRSVNIGLHANSVSGYLLYPLSVGAGNSTNHQFKVTAIPLTRKNRHITL